MSSLPEFDVVILMEQLFGSDVTITLELLPRPSSATPLSKLIVVTEMDVDILFSPF